MATKRAVIIAGGWMSDFSYIKQFLHPQDTIITADSGYLYAKQLGLSPHIALGDFDSLGFVPEDVPVYQVSTQKDLTDTELALQWARSQGYEDFLFLAVLGSRMDHSLSNIFLLNSLLKQGESGQIINEHNQIWLTDSSLTLPIAPGSTVSLIPLSTCHGVTSSGLLYPLFNSTLAFDESLGVSNVSTENPVSVSLREGKLLVIVAKD